MGAGMLSIPLAIYNCGIVLGSLMIFVAGITFQIYYRIIVSALIET